MESGTARQELARDRVLEQTGTEQTWYSFHKPQAPSDVNPVQNYYISYSSGCFLSYCYKFQFSEKTGQNLLQTHLIGHLDD